jgi:hypothetical protein
VVVVQLEDLDDLIEALGLSLDTIADVAFSTAKESLLVTLGIANDLKWAVLVCETILKDLQSLWIGMYIPS